MSDTQIGVKPERAVVDLRVEAVSRGVGGVADGHVPEQQRDAASRHELRGPVSEETVQAQLGPVGVFPSRG